MTACFRRIPISQIKANPRNRRTHSRRQIKQIAESIRAFGFTSPVLVDETDTLLAGHGRVKGAQEAGLRSVPAIQVSGLTEAKKRALLIADNKIALNAGWDWGQLAVEIPELGELLSAEGLDVSLTGFEPVEIDQIVLDAEEHSAEPDDIVDPGWHNGPKTTRKGDLWTLGDHRLLCGDARCEENISQLMGAGRAAAAFLDPPYNLKIAYLVGRGRTRHREFAMGSGEMTPSAYASFLAQALTVAIAFSAPGAVHYVCMDWRHVDQLLGVAGSLYGETLNLVVWVKSNAGQGSFYRSQHELIGVFRNGSSPHLNNIQMGRHGRNRSNVWRYSGVNTFRTGRMEELAAHPTAKPVALVADALRDCTRRGDLVLDTFAGSGTTIMAAERVGRKAYAIEIDPQYVDVAIRRWQSFTGRDAVLSGSGRCFDEIAAMRSDGGAALGQADRGGRR